MRSGVTTSGTGAGGELSDPAVLLAVAEMLSPSLNGASSHRLADVTEASLAGSAEPADVTWVLDGLRRLDASRVSWWHAELERLGDAGVTFISTADAAYPANLRMIPNRPPFLFIRGSLNRTDERAMAVVGTRKPSGEGATSAFRIAEQLASRGVTVVSGLAQGIDTAAHEGALSSGGRTLAVFGTGIERIFPAVNRDLAKRVAASGACVSQFWPSTSGARWTFPVRNLVTSGLSLGTIVVEAGETSGARLQAQDAIRHGKRVFLMRQLVMSQAWAREAAASEGVATLDSVDEVLEAVDIELSADLSLL